MKILLVEDDNVRSGELKKYLQSKSIEVLTANDGFEAMLLLKSQKVNLILSDVNMMGMDGLVLAKNVKAEKTILGVPFFLYSSRPMPEDIKELAIEMGADRCMANTEVNEIGDEALKYMIA